MRGGARAGIISGVPRPTVGGDMAEVIGHNVAHGESAGCVSARASYGALRLGEAHYAYAIGLFEVVGEDNGAVGCPQVFDGIAALAAVAPRNPRAGAAGELAIAEVQSRLDQSEIRLVTYRKSAAGGSGFEVRAADFSWHGGKLPVQYGSNTGPIYAVKHPWTTVDKNIGLSALIGTTVDASGC
jgi:hypothetical protein